MLLALGQIDAYFWIDLVLSILIIGFLIYEIFRLKVSYRIVTRIIIFSILLLIINIFNLRFIRDLLWMIGVLYALYLVMTLDAKEKDKVLFHHKKDLTITSKLSLSETDKLFNILNKTVTDLSNSKTGALITIERKDNLTPFLSTSGVSVDAPVSAELLETIFVNKTPLHDGAVIIRGNYIVAASVFYQPTQKALSGKYGSRHRAALGISEVCDAITIVVSEETGRVSFAIDGELTTIPVTDFINKLKEYY